MKTQVVTTQRQLMRDLEVLPLEEATTSAKSMNVNGACQRGKLLRFLEQVVVMVVAVDVDEGHSGFRRRPDAHFLGDSSDHIYGAVR
uniref:Uncharacterized protein n=1 Tax=Zea mays TaxID=4577 RepID=A0A804MUS8_MAIZE